MLSHSLRVLNRAFCLPNRMNLAWDRCVFFSATIRDQILEVAAERGPFEQPIEVARWSHALGEGAQPHIVRAEPVPFHHKGEHGLSKVRSVPRDPTIPGQLQYYFSPHL